VGVAFDEEHARSSMVDVVSYDVFVDLTGEGDTFCSRTELGFRCRRDGASVFADLQAAGVRRMILNGQDLPSGDLHRDGRLELPGLGEENILVVEAEFSYAQESGACIGSPVRAMARPACTARGSRPGHRASSAVSTSRTCAPR